MKQMTREKQEKLLAILLLLGLIAAVIPLLIMGHYNFKSVDDYSYAIRSEPVWQETHSLGKLLWSQILVSADMWKNWQGIYFGDFVMTSSLGLWGTNGYFMGAYLNILGLVAGELLAAHVILGRGLGASRSQTVIAAVPCILLQILLIPSPAEGFYWMCGALLYTFVFALSMVFLAILIIYLEDGGSVRRKAVLEALTVLFSFMIAGCTYPTALGTLLILACMTVWCFYRKKRQRMAMVCNTCLYLLFFLFNVLSPGAAARQNSAGGGMGAAQAVLSSLKEAALYIKNWTALPVLLVMLFLTPVFLGIVKRKGFKFRYPVVATVLSFGIFAAHFTPCLYAIGITGPYRVQNIYRFLLYIWLFGNELYWLGWLRTFMERRRNAGEPGDAGDGEVRGTARTGEAGKTGGAAKAGNASRKAGRYLPAGIIAIAVTGLSLLWYAGDRLTTVSALLSLKRGEAADYREEYTRRLEILEDETVSDAYLEPFSCKPYLLYFGDVETDPEHWANKAVAEYYGKASVRLTQ